MKLRFTLNFYFVLYFLLLLVLYHYKIKTYFYWGYIAHVKEITLNISTFRLLLACIVFFINLKTIQNIKNQKIIYSVTAIFFILLTIPSLISFTVKSIYPVKLLIYHQLFFYALFLFPKVKINLKNIPVVNKKEALFLFFIVTTLGIIPYLIILGPYINMNNLLFKDIYETRKVMSEFANPYFGYSYAIFTKIIIPLLIIFSLELKKYYLTIIGSIYLVLFYLFGAHKTVYVGLFVVFIFYKLSHLQNIKKLLTVSNILIVLSILLTFFSIDDLWIILFRRTHFIPTLLDYCYLDFFQDKPIYWSETITKRFITYPFDYKHPYLIGKNYFRNVEMAANNGLISDGFMNFGTIGVLVNIFLISTYFMILNNLKIPSKYFGLFLLVIISFISSSTFTVFLTHGAFALLLISIFVLNEKKN